MVVSNRRFSLGILGLAFILGSFNTVQLLPTMDEMEYSQAGYFTITNQDRSRQIWNEEPMIFYQGRPELIERGPLYNVTSRELMAWSDIIFDYGEYLSERGVQLSFLFEPRNGVIKVGICDLTDEKAQLFVELMKHYVPMGVIILQNATIIKLTGRFGDLDYSESGMQLRLEVITDKTEYTCGEEITAEGVVINDYPYPVTITPPTVFDATGYGVDDPVDSVSQSCSITWAKSEIEIPANSSTVLCSFSFRSEEPGPFIIRISGFPEKEVIIVESDKEHAENFWDRDYRIQVPEDSEGRTLRGILGLAPFPLSKYEASTPTDQDFTVEDILMVEIYHPFDEPSGEWFYMFQDDIGIASPRSSDFYTENSTGDKLLGGVTLTELGEARAIELTVEVEGDAFTYERMGETYRLVKVKGIRIHEAWRLPLLVSHDFELVSGNYHSLFSGEERVEFPCELPVGYIHHEGKFGNAEHNLHVLLNEGEGIHIEFNSTGPIHFGLLKPNSHISHGYYDPGSTSFYFAREDDFYVREANVTRTSFEFTATKRGYHNLLFKAYTGTEGTVTLNITRLEN
ncbi:hypothetical protein ES703_12997 [subsurface metagenome]